MMIDGLPMFPPQTIERTIEDKILSLAARADRITSLSAMSEARTIVADAAAALRAEGAREERARIVAWGRSVPDDGCPFPRYMRMGFLDAIERGDLDGR